MTGADELDDAAVRELTAVLRDAATFDAMTPEARVQEYRRREQENPASAQRWALLHTIRLMQLPKAAG